MKLMLGESSTLKSRTDLRIELSDYLNDRADALWMHELMERLGEVDADDLKASKSQEVHPEELDITTTTLVAVPAFPAPAKEAVDEALSETTVDEETFNALQWTSRLPDYSSVLSLIQSLPKEIVREQVVLYRNRHAEAAVAAATKQNPKIGLNPKSRYTVKMLVAARFHTYCQSRGIVFKQRMPYGLMKQFIEDNIIWDGKGKNKQLTGKTIREWHNSWSGQPGFDVNAVAGQRKKVMKEKCFLKSRAPVAGHLRLRGLGGGARYKAPLIRRALYEWWSSIRYAIDWKKLAENRRNRGKKHLARFPRSVLRVKVNQLQADQAAASILHGVPVVTIKPTSWWFRRWEEEFGLAMRQANRKYAVPRYVQKERMEIFWIVLFRVRLFIFMVFGYDPWILNWDQSPFHHNESGAQNKPTLGIRGSIVPVVEGNSDVKSRWTAQLVTSSRFPAVAGGSSSSSSSSSSPAVAGGSSRPPFNGFIPPAECMFKAEPDGPVDKRLQEFIRSRGFPSWFTVTVGPKGSYRERDIIELLQKHLEPWGEGRDWRIMLADDCTAHRSANVFELCWVHGYIFMLHGGGSTPVAQTVDTDLNEFVRKDYGEKEARVLIEQMRCGQNVPCLKHEDCMVLMFETLSNPALHARAAAGYKSVGQSIELWGKEDHLIIREAGVFWREETTCKQYKSMRPKINAELGELKEEVDRGRLTWSKKSVKRLILPYPPRDKVDKVLNALEDDFYHDDIHNEGGVAEEEPAVAEEDGGVSSGSSVDEESDHDEPGGLTAVADDCTTASDDVIASASASADILLLSDKQADEAQNMHTTMSALESAIEGLRATGSLRSVQVLELELTKERRRLRALTQESPAVAEAFLRFRAVEDQDAFARKRLHEQETKKKREAAKAIADRDAAVAELKRVKNTISETEALKACKYAVKTYTVQALGDGTENGGGYKGRILRWEVLDRLARLGAGLSDGQKNDWTWFKSSWDEAMLAENPHCWPMIFAGYVQGVLDDVRTNAFSEFVFKETSRVFSSHAALSVPGS